MTGNADDITASLVQLAREGDQAAFADLVVRHRPVALRLCKRLLRDDGRAEDGVQEAVLVAWLNLDTLRQTDRFGAWLAGIALRVCHGWLRYHVQDAWSLEALVGGRVLPEPIDLAAPQQESLELAELGAMVRRAVAELAPSQRSAVALFYLAGMSHAETAALLGIDVGAVKARLHKARGRLRLSLWELWSEEHMTTERAREFIDVHVEDVRAVPIAEPPGERRVVLLAEDSGERLLSIWVGQFEGDSIAISLVGAEAPRPLTFAFAARLLEAASGRVREVRINRLTEDTFYAEVVLDSAKGTRTIDARPSDAIALALVSGATIRVAAEVMEQAGRTPAELRESRPAESRSARERADKIREVVAMPTGRWSSPTVF
ncbi:MAG TPA: bifunctional nuclease domain-containing protein [Chloroflexota bacterium]|nr:bifunctional nuclease domain-containing protein [Chloroflexota bacterium]